MDERRSKSSIKVSTSILIIFSQTLTIISHSSSLVTQRIQKWTRQFWRNNTSTVTSFGTAPLKSMTCSRLKHTRPSHGNASFVHQLSTCSKPTMTQLSTWNASIILCAKTSTQSWMRHRPRSSAIVTTTKSLIGGSANWKLNKSNIFRNPQNKYYVSLQDYPQLVYPTFCQGSSYLVTRDGVSALLDHTHEVPFLRLEDVLFTGIVAQAADVDRHGAHAFGFKVCCWKPRLILLIPLIFRLIHCATTKMFHTCQSWLGCLPPRFRVSISSWKCARCQRSSCTTTTLLKSISRLSQSYSFFISSSCIISSNYLVYFCHE